MLFAPKSQKIVGLDISDTAVKLLELSGGANSGGKQPTKVKVEHYAVYPLQPGSVVEKSIVEPEAVADAIAQAVRKSGTRTKRAAVAVGGSSTITKYISLPAGLNPRQLEQQVEVEAEQHIPFPIEEVSLDFEVLGPKPGDPDMLNILLAAARSDIVDARVTALELAGMEAGVVDLEIFALENACSLLSHQILPASKPARGESKNGSDDKVHVAVVDVGSSTTSLTVLENGRPVYTRDQQFGGQVLTEEIMQHFDLSFEEAGFAKKSGKMPNGVTEEAYAKEVLRPFMREMAQQVNRAIQLYQSATSSTIAMGQIILAGGCAAIQDIDRVVQAETGIPTVIADPFAKNTIAIRAMPNRVKADAASLLIAAGLAMRAFD